MKAQAELGGYTWYGYDPKESFRTDPLDLIFIDGPPEGLGHGRDGAVLRSLSNIGKGTQIWLHDGSRPGERQAVARWDKLLLMRKTLSTKHDPRGVWHLEVNGVR